MRDPARIDVILNEIREYWTNYPDLRLTQLIVNLVRSPEPCPQIFYFEDDRLLEALKKANVEHRE